MRIKCKPGDRIRLTRMDNDPDPIPIGTTGTVVSVSDFGASAQIRINWDIDRSLALVLPEDEFDVIAQGEAS